MPAPATSFLDFYRSDDGRQFLLRQCAGLLAAGLALAAVFGSGDLDHRIALLFFDDVQRSFPLANQPLLKGLLHDQARVVSALAAIGVLGLTLAVWWAPAMEPRLNARRRELAFVSAALFTAAAVIGTLKHFSGHACPWDLAEFNNSLLRDLPRALAQDGAPIRGCLPAAHPLVGYVWMAVALPLLPTARRRAWQWWAIAFSLGSLFGLVQVARGAHFLSHVLWSGWGVWAVNIALVAACCGAPKRAAAAPRPRAPAASTEASSSPRPLFQRPQV
jgi:membrane-associated PAP2 superfamily phosphatase